jgi:hypothetical protein
MAKYRPACVDVAKKAIEHGIELSGRFPERRMAESVQAMTTTFPQIGVDDAIHIIEVDDAICPAVHHRERNRARPDDLPLVDSFPGACDAAAARYGIPASIIGDGMDTWHWWVGVELRRRYRLANLR